MIYFNKETIRMKIQAVFVIHGFAIRGCDNSRKPIANQNRHLQFFSHLFTDFKLTCLKKPGKISINGEPSIFLLPIFLLHKIKVAPKSLWSFSD